MKREERTQGSLFRQGMQLGGGKSRRIQKGERGLGLSVSFQFGVGARRRSATVWDIHSWLFCASVDWDQRVGSWRGGQHGGRS